MTGSDWNKLQRYMSRGTCFALLSILAIFMLAVTASAQAPIVISQTTNYAALPAGGTFAGQIPVGTSWGVNSAGVVVVSTTYGNEVVQYAAPTYTPTVAGPFGNAAGVAIDSKGYLYVSDQYNQDVVKFPMSATGTYSWSVDPTTSGNTPPACAGDGKTPDSAGPCLLAPLTTNADLGYFGIGTLAFDASNNLYFATDDAGGEPYTIYQCGTKCLYPASGTTAPDPVLIYAEPITPAGLIATQGQLTIGSIAFDPWGDLFFTDAAVWASAPCTPQQSFCTTGPAAYTSNLNELPTVIKSINPTLFAASPTVILTETNATPIAPYNDAIDALAISTNGNVYIGLANTGIYGLISNGNLNGDDNGTATVSSSSLFGVSSQGTHLLASDNNGNFYTVANSNVFSYIYTGPVRFPGPVTVGTPESVNVLVADNAETCANEALSFSESGGAFTTSPTTGTSCANMSLGPGSFIPTTFTYTPAATGFVPGTITASDGSSSTAQTVASSGQAVTISQSTWGAAFDGGGAWAGSSPDGSSGAVNSLGFMVVGNSYGDYVQEFSPGNINISSTSQTVTALGGKLQTPGAVAIDTSNNIYVSSEISYDSSYGSNIVLKFPMNSDGTYPPVPSSCTTQPCDALILALPVCQGTSADSAGICQIVVGGANAYFGVAGMVMDTHGNLFFTTDSAPLPSGSSATWEPYQVYECGPTCLYGANPTAPVLLWSEPVALANQPQLNLGAIAIDPSGNLYFTDSMITPLATEMSLYSDLYQLPVDASSSTGFAANPTLLETLTPVCTALAGCTYNNAITTVATDSGGNVYFGTPFGGIYEIQNNSGTLNYQFPIAIAAQSAKILIPDGTGNFDFVSYNGGDTAGYLLIGSAAISNIASPGAPQSVTNVSAIDNYVNCLTGASDLTVAAVDTDFSGTATGCGTLPFGTDASFGLTLTFNPSATASGTVSTTMTATNSATGDTGTANLTGQAALPQTITFTNPAASESIPYSTTPIVLAATGGATGNPVTFAVTSGPGTLAADGVTLTITGVGPIVITASEAAGTVGGVAYAAGTATITITVVAATQTIAFTPPATAAYGSGVTLSATGGDSGNPVTFSLDASSTAGVATLNGSSLTVTGIGSIVIDANEEGNADYAAATQVQATIMAVPAAQAITISANPTSPVYPATSTITATGGASGLPVTLSIMSGSTIATLSGTTLTPTGAAFGAVVVAANQAGNTDYAAAAQQTVTVTFTAAGAVATPSISPASGNTLSIGNTNTITITDTTTGAAIWYTTDGSNPLTNPNGTAVLYSKPFTLGTAAGNGTVMAAAVLTGDTPSAVATATYTLVTGAPAFTVTSSATTATVTSSTPANITLSFAVANGFDQAITFSCTPSSTISVSCSFNPATLTATGNDASLTTTLTISKGSGSASLQKGVNPFLPGGATFAALALCFVGFKKRRGLLLALVLILGGIGFAQLTGCGGASSKTGTLTVSATGGGTTQTVTINVTTK